MILCFIAKFLIGGGSLTLCDTSLLKKTFCRTFVVTKGGEWGLEIWFLDERHLVMTLKFSGVVSTEVDEKSQLGAYPGWLKD